MADRARPDANLNNSLIVVSNADGATPVTLYADPTTHALVTSASSSGDTAYISQFYSDSTYTYICKAVPATALASSLWQVKRIASDGSKRYAGGNANFTNAATDLATVQGYSYS